MTPTILSTLHQLIRDALFDDANPTAMERVIDSEHAATLHPDGRVTLRYHGNEQDFDFADFRREVSDSLHYSFAMNVADNCCLNATEQIGDDHRRFADRVALKDLPF